ncbi:glycosyltransferase family 4 protein [Desulfobacterales bacterium HSG2]|nr:glycosyltransferase family 4 protein [Desulfobacterales bacterium HSG2]
MLKDCCETVLSEERNYPHPRCIVSHPGMHHSYQIAFSLQEAGLLEKFITRFYYKDQGFFDKILRFFPRKYSKLLQYEFKRRKLEGLNENLICSYPCDDLFFKVLRSVGPINRVLPDTTLLTNSWHDTRTAKIVRSLCPNAVFCFDGSALYTFNVAREVGAVCILSQMIGYIKAGLRIMNEEAWLHPDFADTMSLNNVREVMIERCTEEILTADFVLAGSDYVKESLYETGVSASRIVVLPYGADIDRFRPRPKHGNHIFRILFVGSITQRKGIKYLLEAFKRLALPRAELVLVGGIIGSGEGLKPYRNIFRHIPHVPHFEVHKVFQNSDIFVYPSLHEGSAIAVYEALASGLPVITTPNSGSVVCDRKEGYIVPIRDVEALMEKILLLYEDQYLRDSMSRNARELAKSFTWEKYHQSLSGIVRGFIREKKV